MRRWFLTFVAVATLASVLIGVVSAEARAAQPAVALRLSDPAGQADAALVDALSDVELLGDWLRSADVAPQAALLRVAGGAEYAQARADLIATLEKVRDRQRLADARLDRLDDAEERMRALERLTVELRRRTTDAKDSISRALSTDEVRVARYLLAGAGVSQPVGAFTLDPVGLVEYRLGRLRDDLVAEIETDTSANLEIEKQATPPRVDFADFADDFDEVRALLAIGRQAEIAARLRIAAERAEAVGLMGPLHRLRMDAPTGVSGLSLVTVDAYVKGATSSGCGMDWTLLAAIGHVESRHGTLGDSVVRASGALSVPILGPLLDGGATAAEARAAAERRAREAEAAAEEAARALAEPAETPNPTASFDTRVWGAEALARVEGAEAARREADRSVLERLAPPTPTPTPTPRPTPTPEFDARAWGIAVAGEPEAPTPDPDEDDEDTFGDEPPRALGNGFAVIRDSDNGRLDGNSRWDRAVGPMQFLPETWQRWETDGNADGVIDPQNLYDAAATAGRFLCHLQQVRGASPERFVMGYNPSSAYVRNVVGMAASFARYQLPALGGAM